MFTAEKSGLQRWAAAVIMERSPVTSRWVSEKWEARGVVPDLAPASPPRVLTDRPELMQVLYSGLQIVLQRDEAEGYYMNITSPQPKAQAGPKPSPSTMPTKTNPILNFLEALFH